MESNQGQPTNGASGTGKTGLEGAGAGKPERSVVGVIDQLLNATIDHVLNAEAAVRENTAQLRVLASSVELVRGLPNKMDVLTRAVAASEARVGTCIESMSKLCERMEVLERAAVQKLGERMDGLEFAMRQLAAKPAEWKGEMQSLEMGMRQHAALFENPQEKRVYHRHYLHWYGWIIFGICVVCSGFVFLWHDASEDAVRNSGNDILWRGAWEISDSVLHAKLVVLKNECDTNTVQFRRAVEEDEENDAELTRRLKEQNMKQEDADAKKAEADEKQRDANAEKQENEELKRQRGKR